MKRIILLALLLLSCEDKMAGSLVNVATATDPNPENILETQDTQRKGYHGLTLTEFTSSTVPAIAAGSNIEVAGALYAFDSEEAISLTDPETSSTVADGKVYIRLLPSGSSITAAFTATAPTWNDGLQGWYEDATASADQRYLWFYMTKASTVYSNKFIFPIPKIDYYAIPAAENANSLVSAYLTSDLSITTAQDVIFDAETIDTNSEYNTTTGEFVALYNGYYDITFNYAVTTVASLSQIAMLIDTGSGYGNYRRVLENNANTTGLINDIVYLAAGHKIKFNAQGNLTFDADVVSTGIACTMTVRECPVSILRK